MGSDNHKLPTVTVAVGKRRTDTWLMARLVLLALVAVWQASGKHAHTEPQAFMQTADRASTQRPPQAACARAATRRPFPPLPRSSALLSHPGVHAGQAGGVRVAPG